MTMMRVLLVLCVFVGAASALLMVGKEKCIREPIYHLNSVDTPSSDRVALRATFAALKRAAGLAGDDVRLTWADLNRSIIQVTIHACPATRKTTELAFWCQVQKLYKRPNLSLSGGNSFLEMLYIEENNQQTIRTLSHSESWVELINQKIGSLTCA